jgi:hypothetical protein
MVIYGQTLNKHNTKPYNKPSLPTISQQRGLLFLNHSAFYLLPSAFQLKTSAYRTPINHQNTIHNPFNQGITPAGAFPFIATKLLPNCRPPGLVHL